MAAVFYSGSAEAGHYVTYSQIVGPRWAMFDGIPSPPTLELV